MKIAILTSSYPRFPGDGTAPFIKSIAENLLFLGHDVHVIAPYDDEVKEDPQGVIKVTRYKYIWPDRFHIMGHSKSLAADIKLRPLSVVFLPLFLLKGIICLFQVTKKQKSDVIHVNWVLPNGPIGLVVALLRHLPYAVSLHGSDGYVAKKNHLFRLVAKTVFKKARAVTACSQELYETAIELGADPAHTHLLAWGADPEKFRPKENKGDQSKGRRIMVSSLGRMVYKKGFDKLIMAWKKVRTSEEECSLILGGDGPLLDDLQRQVNDLGLAESISFIGRVPWDQVPSFLQKSDIFVLPSLIDKNGNMDGLPTVLLEAMACGNAVVASRLGGVPLVIRDHVNGLLVQPGDHEELAEAITYLLGNTQERRIYQKAARESVELEFNWTNVVQFLVKCFSE